MEPNTLIALAAAGGLICLGLLLFGGESSNSTARVKKISGRQSASGNILSRLKVEDSGGRRKQIEETLGKIEERQRTKKKKAKSLPSRLIQANWSMSPQTFMIICVVLAVVAGGSTFVMGVDPKLCAGITVIAGFGVPRFILMSAINRRQAKFTAHFADAMDIIVRGVRTGLPLGDCLKIIAHESPEPLGGEFRKVVEGESVGMPIEICLEQMFERMPISEVNFFATVLNIQKTTGGNLGESLSNLSNVLRGRKMLREKIKALSAEAKASAIIIGALPICVMLLVTIAAPDYMDDLYNTKTGQQNMLIGVVMMAMGIFMMRKMINFKF